MKIVLLSLVTCAFLASGVVAQQYNLQPLAKSEEKGVRGYVLVSAIFRASGEITDIKILNHPAADLEKEASLAVKKIKFTPAIKDGRPVSVRMQMEFTFQFLQAAKIELRQALQMFFSFLSPENLDALVKTLEKNRENSISPDTWTIAREQAGIPGLSNDEQKEYQGLKNEAIKRLPLELKIRAEKAQGAIPNKPIDDMERVVFSNLLFEGARSLSKENRARFVELYNKAMALGLKQFEGQ